MIESNDVIEFEIGYEEQAILESGGEIVINTIFATILKNLASIQLQVTNKRSATSRRRFLPKITAVVVDATKTRIVLSQKQH
ncbi:MAG: hypothetical protein WC878_05075 [Candidatus Paceibacterota bacterium]|jgi:hypothetical protein